MSLLMNSYVVTRTLKFKFLTSCSPTQYKHFDKNKYMYIAYMIMGTCNAFGCVKEFGVGREVSIQMCSRLLEDPIAFLSVAHVVDACHGRQPRLQLRLPVDQHGVGHDDQVGPVVLLVLHQIGDERHHL